MRSVCQYLSLKATFSMLPKLFSPHKPALSRRRFLAGAALAAVPALAAAQAPKPAVGSPIVMRWQSTWSAKDIFYEYVLDYAKKVHDISGGRLKIEVLPAGAVVKSFNLLDAVAKGALDGGHGVPVFWHDRNPAFSLFGSGPALGMDANGFLAWMEHGGGKELYAELLGKVMNLDVLSFFYGPMPTQPLGWFGKPVASAAQFKGLKFRAVGLPAEMFRELGAVVNALPDNEIVPALKGGSLDAAELNNASSDRMLGMADVSKTCMLQSYHQPAEVFEILWNRRKYDALPPDLRSILSVAAQAASADMSWKAVHRYSLDYAELREKRGVSFHRTPNEVLRAQLRAWSAVAARTAKENPFFKKVLDSQLAWTRRTVGWSLDTIVDPRMAYDHWFGRKPAPAGAKK
jgi:TRAP-type mannitol/chloroaromatic compound transport system substrate-binding protein